MKITKEINSIKTSQKQRKFYNAIQIFITGHFIGNIAGNSGHVSVEETAGLKLLGQFEGAFEKITGLYERLITFPILVASCFSSFSLKMTCINLFLILENHSFTCSFA